MAATQPAIAGKPNATPPPAALQAVPLQGAMEIPLSQIAPSKTNRRTVRKAERDAELADSIRTHGVQEPIILRPGSAESVDLEKYKRAGHTDPKAIAYQIVAGERRWEMSHRTGRQTIPAIVRNLNNAEALEVQNIENLQREDLDPLDRAEAIHDLYQQYLKAMTPKDALTKIAGRLNCEQRTLYNMMSLRKLLPDVQRAIAAGELSTSAGYVLGTLSPDPQKRVWSWFKNESQYRTVGVRNLQEFIRNQVFRRLAGAPWNLDDARLVAAAGACSACLKNTAVNPLLSEEKKPTCTDLACYDSKQQAYLVNIVTEAKKEAPGGKVVMVAGEHGQSLVKDVIDREAWKEAKEGSCSYSTLALIATGGSAGKKQFVCMNRKCSKHWQPWERQSSSFGSSSSRGSGERSESEKKAMLQKQRNKKLDQAYRTAVSAALRKQVTELKTADLQEIAAVLYDRLDNKLMVPIMEVMGWKVGERYAYRGLAAPAKQIADLKPAELCSFIALLAIAENVLPVSDYWGAKNGADLAGFAKRHKIDLEKIKAQAEAPLKAKFRAIDERKKAAAASTSATTKAKGKSAGKKAA